MADGASARHHRAVSGRRSRTRAAPPRRGASVELEPGPARRAPGARQPPSSPAAGGEVRMPRRRRRRGSRHRASGRRARRRADRGCDQAARGRAPAGRSRSPTGWELSVRIRAGTPGRSVEHFEQNSERLTPARSATSAAGRGVQVLSAGAPRMGKKRQRALPPYGCKAPDSVTPDSLSSPAGTAAPVGAVFTSPISRETLGIMPHATVCVKTESDHHAVADRVEVRIKHPECSNLPCHSAEPLQRNGVQHVALRPGFRRSELARQRARIHPVMKRLHRNRGGGAQRHDGAELGHLLRARRNHHNWSNFGHLWNLETGVEIAHPQRAGPRLVLQRHRAMLSLWLGVGQAGPFATTPLAPEVAVDPDYGASRESLRGPEAAGRLCPGQPGTARRALLPADQRPARAGVDGADLEQGLRGMGTRYNSPHCGSPQARAVGG